MSLEDDLAAAKAEIEHIEQELRGTTAQIKALATTDITALTVEDIQPSFIASLANVVHSIEHRAFGRQSAETPVTITTIINGGL